jgi:hypothetical protein
MKTGTEKKGAFTGEKEGLFLRLLLPFPIKEHIQISKEDDAYLKGKGSQYNLAPFLYTQLLKYRQYFSPGEIIRKIIEELKPSYMKSIALCIQRQDVEKEIHLLLAEKEVPSVTMRGNEIAGELYEDPYCRISSDIDILIRLSDVIKVDDILKAQGYFRNEQTNLRFWFYRLHHAVYHHPKTHDIIEMHWNFGIPSFWKLSSDDIWRAVVPGQNNRLRLAPEMQMVMLLMHHHMHFFRELRILTDIIWGFSKYEKSIDWKMFVRTLERIGLIKTTRIALSQMKGLWDETISDMEAVRILTQELEKGRKANLTLASYFEMDLEREYTFESLKDKLVARFALDHISTISRSFIKLLFPLPGVINELYEDRRKWMLPINYMKFIKWRVKDWIGG